MMQFCDRLSQLLIVPQEELKKVVAEEVEAFGKEFPLRTETEMKSLLEKK